MPKQPSHNSVSTKASKLNVDETFTTDRSLKSVAVMISNLRKKEEHKEKKFKIKQVDGVVSVTRHI